jgi:type II secretory pathway pseudopilin PulG
VPARATEEDGFGLIELLFAMVMLNIGILALVAAFQSGTVALARSSSVSNGAAVADKTMEVFRGLKSCQIYLSAPSGGGADTGSPALPNGIPNSTSTWYARYTADPSAYANVTYFNYNGSTPLWVTSPAGSGSYSGIAAPCTQPTLPSGSPDPTKAVQYVTGPDGQKYPVFIYDVVVQPKDANPTPTWTAGYVKQVTVTVLNPQKTTQILARETSYFDPNVTG